MRLAELMAHLPVRAVHGELPAGEVTSLAYDSRRVAPGGLFAALPGVKADGHAFLPAAARAGALAALVEHPTPGLALCQLEVADAREALALAAHHFHGRPSERMRCVGITGTNGKTTTSYFLEALFSRHGPVGVIGTVETRWPGRRRPAAMTTPESADLHALLAEMRAAGVEQAVMELSSHALCQHRAAGVALAAGIFTNLTRDHLDYHRDLEGYFAAKALLFTELLPRSRERGLAAAAVIGVDDPRGERLAALAAGHGLAVTTFGFAPSALVRGGEPELSLAGGRMRVSSPWGGFAAATPLVGRFNLENYLAAAACGLALGIAPAEVAAGLNSLAGVPGRLERVGGPEGPAVFVDYAHTDDALKNVLGALRPLTPGRLLCVFGAGGDRDHGKRPLMGREVARGADLAVLTSDNPRGEEPLTIMAQVAEGLAAGGMTPAAPGAPPAPGSYLAEPDRAAAIELAIALAGPDDVVLIAGKGHEDYQILGAVRRHFDDREEAARALAARREGRDGHAKA